MPCEEAHSLALSSASALPNVRTIGHAEFGSDSSQIEHAWASTLLYAADISRTNRNCRSIASSFAVHASWVGASIAAGPAIADELFKAVTLFQQLRFERALMQDQTDRIGELVGGPVLCRARHQELV